MTVSDEACLEAFTALAKCVDVTMARRKLLIQEDVLIVEDAIGKDVVNIESRLFEFMRTRATGDDGKARYIDAMGFSPTFHHADIATPMELVCLKFGRNRSWKNDPVLYVRSIAADLLGPSRAVIRRHFAATSPEGGRRIHFLTPDRIDPTLRELFNLYDRSSANPVASSIALFWVMIHAHPFADGNKRLARAIFQASLIQKGYLRVPVLPIGPFYEADLPLVRAATDQWLEEGCLALAANVMIDICSQTLDGLKTVALTP